MNKVTNPTPKCLVNNAQNTSSSVNIEHKLQKKTFCKLQWQLNKLQVQFHTLQITIIILPMTNFPARGKRRVRTQSNQDEYIHTYTREH